MKISCLVSVALGSTVAPPGKTKRFTQTSYKTKKFKTKI